MSDSEEEPVEDVPEDEEQSGSEEEAADAEPSAEEADDSDAAEDAADDVEDDASVEADLEDDAAEDEEADAEEAEADDAEADDADDADDAEAEAADAAEEDADADADSGDAEAEPEAEAEDEAAPVEDAAEDEPSADADAEADGDAPETKEEEDADAGEPIRPWMKKEGFFDTIIETVLIDAGVSTTGDFKTLKESQWDEIVRESRVQKKEEIDDTKVLRETDRKLAKIEKFWRKMSGIPSKKVKPASGERPVDESSTALRDEALKKGADLKKWMKKNEVLDIDLLVVLVTTGVCAEADLPKMDSNEKWDEVCRQVRVEKQKESVDTKKMSDLEKLLVRFEKLWRKVSGVKRKTVKVADDKERREDTSSRVVRDQAVDKGRELKNYMKKNGCLDIDLLIVLVLDFDVCAEADLKKIDDDLKWDEVVRKVKVAKNTTDAAKIKTLEGVLQKFEKLWRKATGVKKGAGKKAHKPKAKKTKKGSGAADDEKSESKETDRDAALKKGAALKKFMKKGGFLNIDLLVILVADYEVCSEDDLGKLDSNAKWDEVCRKTRVALNSTDSAELKKLEGVLTKFGKEWRKKTGIKASASAKKKGGKKKDGKGKADARASAMSESSDMDKLMADSADLKKWLRKEQVFDKELYQELLRREIKNEEMLSAVTDKEINDICLAVKVQVKKDTKDAGTRARLDKTLSAFEKAWKGLSGGKKKKPAAKKSAKKDKKVKKAAK